MKIAALRTLDDVRLILGIEHSYGRPCPKVITVSEEDRQALLDDAKFEREPAHSNRGDYREFPEHFTLFGVVITTEEREKKKVLKRVVKETGFIETLKLAAEIYPRRNELETFIRYCYQEFPQ